MSLVDPPVELTVTIIEADGLPKMDLFSQTDAFCVLKLRNGHHPPQRTQPYPNDAHPIWDETFKISLASSHNRLTIEVRDKDAISGAEPIGMVEFVLNELQIGVEVEDWYPIVPAQGIRTGGRIRIRMLITRQGVKVEQQPSNPVTAPDPGRARPKPFIGAVKSPT
jgi:hypothetical protein